MNYRIALILSSLLFSWSALQANDMENDYEQVKQSFDLRTKNAQNDLKKYLNDYPYTTYNNEVQCMLGILQTEKGKYKNATKTFSKADWKFLTREQQPMYFFYRGYAYLNQGDTKKAASCFKPLRESVNPFSTEGSYYYAYCWYKEGDYERALPEFLALEHTAQYRNIVPYYIVQIYYAQHNYAEVFDRIRYLLTQNPDNANNAELHRILGEAYYAQGKYQVAVTNFKEYERLSAQTKSWKFMREDLYLVGVSQYRLGEYEDAIAYLKRVPLRQDTLSESTCLHLGHAYQQTGDKERAKLNYAAAMRYGITPQVQEEAMFNYALATYESGSALGESVKAFEDFLAAYPNTEHAEQVYELLADMYMSSKNYLAAYESISKISKPSAKLTQTRQYLRYQIGADKLAQGNMEECKQWMTEVINNSSAASLITTDAYYYRAESEYALHENDDCLRDLKRYFNQPNINESGNITSAYYLEGYAQLYAKHFDDAEQAFRLFIAKADKKQPTYADALNRIGDCCFDKRQFPQAVEAYNQVVAAGKNGVDYALFQGGYAYGLMHQYDDKIASLNRLSETFPKSDYADDALYEMARVQVQQNLTTEALATYTKLIQKYPNSNLARQASLELAMTYRNMGQNDKALAAFRQTIEQYSGSKEAYAALEAMEQVYVENNDVASYLAYARQLGKMNMNISGHEDSLTYTAAELQYILGNYQPAAAGLATYISQFCPGGRYCTAALYYAADANYRIGQKEEAERFYTDLSEVESNPYKEDTYSRLAELCFDRKDYNKAREAFRSLSELGGQSKIHTQALVGILRCSYHLKDTVTLMRTATLLLDDDKVSQDLQDEARYNRGKAFMEMGHYGQAVVDLAELAKNVKVETGAESKYMVAECYYRLGALDTAEEEIMSFAGMKTPHQYWLAKSFILLADINTDKGEFFQAQQYLLALQQNYSSNDEINALIESRLTRLAERQEDEQPKNAEVEEDEE